MKWPRGFGVGIVSGNDGAALFVTSHGGAPQQIVAREPDRRASHRELACFAVACGRVSSTVRRLLDVLHRIYFWRSFLAGRGSDFLGLHGRYPRPAIEETVLEAQRALRTLRSCWALTWKSIHSHYAGAAESSDRRR